MMTFEIWKYHNEDEIAKKYLIKDIQHSLVFRQILRDAYDKYVEMDKDFWQDQDIWFHNRGC